MNQKYTYLLGGLLALYLGDNAWSKDTFCEKICEGFAGRQWCQLNFIHEKCMAKCDASRLDACNRGNAIAQTNKVKLEKFLNGLKKHFCEVACTSGACSQNKIFGAMCVESCPQDTVTNCKAAYEEALRRSLKEKTTPIPEESPPLPGAIPIQDMGPDHIPLRFPPIRPTIPGGASETFPPPPPPAVPVPIHGMRPPPEIVTEQPVPEAYRTIPDQTAQQRID